MRENAKIATKLGYLNIPEDVLVPIDQALKMKPKKVVLMCTGSQGEPTSIMGRLAAGRNRHFDIQTGDTVVLSSHPIPGNEETVYRTINRLFQRGANVIYEPIAPVHVSGHASQEEMKLMLHLVKPKYLIPVHGELRHLRQHAKMGQDLGIPEENIAVVENGTVIEFEGGEMKIGDRIPGGYVFVDGARVGDVGPAVVREREALSRNGFIIVNLLVDGQTQEFIEEPEIITRGFIYKYEADELIDEIRAYLTEVAAEANGQLQEEVEKGLKTFFQQRTKRKPMIFVSVNEV
jgi:ribonuclease J